ncbi:PfkB family carbohydrate kinase [Hyphomicrobium sp. CS1GBMeth3]|uniref:PfkB family carbohydrate kinase n=1 Tax=Hyphomicrobium sp. CS1GBMeth3 TaxID=1892845 RepID=UPI000931FBD5|nr:PfkB family carbohydrate kinase [Hyphomicrobium sp. CS1GBMeth3]
MPAKALVVVGHTALDRVYRIESFPGKPTKVRALDHREEGGGSAANAAAAAAVLGGAVRLWSRVGDDDAGEKARRQLARCGVDVGGVLTCAGAKTPTAAVIVDSNGERLVISEDDHVLPMEADWLPLSEIASAGAVLSDLSWLEGTRAAFAAARAVGVPTLVDVDLGGGILLERVIEVTDYAIFSGPAFERFVPGADDEARLSALLDLGLRHAGVTRGKRGYLWATGEGRQSQEAFEVPVVDTTGAGDAFHGVFALALASGLADTECVRAASAAAALKCRRLGARAGLPSAIELDGFLLEQTGRGLAEGWLADVP